MQGENGAVQGAAGQVHGKVDSRQNRNGYKRREVGSRPGRVREVRPGGDNASALLTAGLARLAWLKHPYPAKRNH